ncbi:hypothetical protein JZ751_029606 [Albula glossodonta]|uniref:Pyrin domain-containing protein n=1 Tax=Albula glossodonta TaxID=121402 RepID=A0A8T2NHT0_9TELE|nr:hypothetical protein JZ751_029606 [Albula glossodonta]
MAGTTWLALGDDAGDCCCCCSCRDVLKMTPIASHSLSALCCDDRTLMKLKKEELKQFQSHLSQYYPECSERQQEDHEALHVVEKMLETCGSERSLEITLQILRKMKQKDLADSLERDEQKNLLPKVSTGTERPIASKNEF